MQHLIEFFFSLKHFHFIISFQSIPCTFAPIPPPKAAATGCRLVARLLFQLNGIISQTRTASLTINAQLSTIKIVVMHKTITSKLTNVSIYPNKFAIGAAYAPTSSVISTVGICAANHAHMLIKKSIIKSHIIRPPHSMDQQQKRLPTHSIYTISFGCTRR